jgi:flavin reductase (DIM6/NTAB) family NADH-FMN oxidoreductase RutF
LRPGFPGSHADAETPVSQTLRAFPFSLSIDKASIKRVSPGYHYPPLVIVSIGKRDDGSDKDSIRNIREREEFVIHIASDDQLHPLNMTSGESEVEVNELDLTRVKGFHMPRLSDCKIAFFCVRHGIQMIGSRKQQSLLFAEVKEVYVADDCAEINEQGRLMIHAERILPLSRLGASQYASFGEVLTAKRPD